MHTSACAYKSLEQYSILYNFFCFLSYDGPRDDGGIRVDGVRDRGGWHDDHDDHDDGARSDDDSANYGDDQVVELAKPLLQQLPIQGIQSAIQVNFFNNWLNQTR